MPNSSSGRSIEDILMPGGKPIGVRGKGPRASAEIRELPGGDTEAERLLKELTVGGTDITPPRYKGKLIRLRGISETVGYRQASKSGPPTIDVNVVDANGVLIPIKKLKFVG